MATQRLREYLRDLEASALVSLDWPHGQPPPSLSVRGVYALYERGELMYIGMSGSGKQLIAGRIRQHKEEARRSSVLAQRVDDPGRIRKWYVRVLRVDDHGERRRLEHYAIAIRWPLYNRPPSAADPVG